MQKMGVAKLMNGGPLFFWRYRRAAQGGASRRARHPEAGVEWI